MSKKNRKNMSESFRFDGSRYGFLGTGFGEVNSYDPYKVSENNEVETREDAWSGGDNLESPTDYTKVYHKLDQVKEPETLTLVSEAHLRETIRKILRQII